MSTSRRYKIYGLVDAADDGRLEDVKEHLQNGVDVNGRDRYGDTALNRAMEGRHSQVVEFLLSKGARYNIRGLCEAAGDGRLEDVKEHLQNGVDVNGRYEWGDTPLSRAANRGHSKVIQFLLSKGARADSRKIYNIRGLCEAAYHGRLEDVKEHLQNGVDVNGTDCQGGTPLSTAANHGYSKVIQFLLSKGARGDSRKIYNIRGLCEAAGDGRLEDVKGYLQNGVDVNGRDRVRDEVADGTEMWSTIRNYEKTKQNTIAALQKCITKAKNQKGKIKVKFIKILFTGSGKAGKTSFNNLLMKNRFVDFHHSTNIVQAKHAVSVKKAFVVGSNQCDDQNVVWLEMNDDSQMSHLRQILLSLDISSLQKTQIINKPKSSLPTTLPQTDNIFMNPTASRGNNVQETSVKKEYVTHQRTSGVQRVAGLFQGSVKSKKMESFDSLVQNSVESTILKHDFDYHVKVFNIITLLDTGGQPEYIHLLPTVNVHPMVTFVVHDLSKSLQDQVLVEYSEHGELVFTPYHLTYSNFDMIKFLMSSINDSLERTSSQVPQLVTIPGKNNSSYLCCVGTHADKISPDIIHNTDRQLTAMVKKLDCKAAVWQNKDGGVLFPVDNTTAGNNGNEDPIANSIRNRIDEIASDKDVYELPITWMLLEMEIRQVCSKNNKGFISFERCCSIAHQTNLIFGIEEVRNALIYHHLLGVLLYYPDIPGLCDYVIVDHQWLFDRISSIVFLTFKQSNILLATDNLKYNGILTKELIQELKWKGELTEGYFITLLSEMRIIAPIQREDGNGEDYFIPYILPTYTIEPQSNDILSQYGCLQGEPLLIQFVSNLLPRGFFCCLAVQILQQLPKGIGNLFTQKDTRHTYSNLITFRLQNAYSLSLIDKLSYLEVQIRHQESYHYCQFPIHSKVQEIICTALEGVCEQLTFNHGRIQYGFHCQCREYDGHIAILTSLIPPFDYALCRYGSVVQTKLKNEHAVWLQEESYQAAVITNVPINQPAGVRPIDQQSTEYKLFTDYYNKLVNTLPASDLSHYFVSDKIIALTDHEDIIRSSTPRQAAKLLLDRVSVQIQNGNTSVFSKMLVIMDYQGVTTAKAISREIRKKLSTIKCEQESSSLTAEAAPPVTETTTQPIGEHSAEYEVFIRYYSQIVNSLSVETLSPYFVSHNIITSAEQMEIFRVPSPIIAAGLLLSKISCALDAEIAEGFYKFLDITEQYGNIDSKTVITAMKKKLLEMKSTIDKGKDDSSLSKAVDSPDLAGDDSTTHTQ